MIGANVFIGSNSSLVAPVTHRRWRLHRVGQRHHRTTCRPMRSPSGGRGRRTSRAMRRNCCASAPSPARPQSRRKGTSLMCGIVGIIGVEPVAPRLVDALKRLEYRGYDSAGVATLEHGSIARRRAEGKLGNLATQARHGAARRARSASATRAGRRMARRPRAMRIRMRPTRSRSSTTASSRISASCSPTSPRTAICPKTQTDTESVALWVTREIDRGLEPELAVGAHAQDFARRVRAGLHVQGARASC